MFHLVRLLMAAGSITLCAQVPQGYVLISKEMTWSDAQSYCREKHTDLVTIKSLGDMKEMSSIAAANGVRSMIWIGLKKSMTTSSGDGWKWSDQSPSTFRQWGFLQPDNDGSCVLYSHQSYTWWDRSCHHKFYFFCYSAVAKRVIVEMESSSSLNLSDPKMSDALLNKIQSQIPGVHLHWRVQPDGKIFRKLSTINE